MQPIEIGSMYLLRVDATCFRAELGLYPAIVHLRVGDVVVVVGLCGADAKGVSLKTGTFIFCDVRWLASHEAERVFTKIS